MQRKIKHIVEHCTASWQTATLADIMKEFADKGWKNPGYHHVIFPDGKIVDLLSIEKVANGVAGYNETCIHYSYVGGIEKKDGKIVPVDNRTKEQKASQKILRKRYKEMFPNVPIVGHRNFSVDKNGNGIVDSWERIKECPCYDVRDEIRAEHLENEYRPKSIVYKVFKPLIYDNNVAIIQQALKKAHIKNEQGNEITVDKYFGDETDFAVRVFQEKNGLDVTGIVDEETQKVLGIRI